MIDPRTRATMFIVGLFVLAFVINLMRTRKLQERYALLWVLAAVGLVLAPLFIPVIDEMAYALGVAYPPALLLALAVVALMLIILQLSLSISHQADHIKVLTQELGLLRQELDDLKGESGAKDFSTLSQKNAGQGRTQNPLLPPAAEEFDIAQVERQT
jgi:hypothetical protein